MSGSKRASQIWYTDGAHDVLPEQLQGFFVGWPDPPTPETHLRMLRQSTHAIMARASDGVVVGYVTAMSDGVLAAFIPQLEVLPEYQHQGIATELVRRMMAKLSGIYSVDLVCDDELIPFYESMGFSRMTAMSLRNYAAQSGEALTSQSDPITSQSETRTS